MYLLCWNRACRFWPQVDLNYVQFSSVCLKQIVYIWDFHGISYPLTKLTPRSDICWGVIQIPFTSLEVSDPWEFKTDISSKKKQNKTLLKPFRSKYLTEIKLTFTFPLFAQDFILLCSWQKKKRDNIMPTVLIFFTYLPDCDYLKTIVYHVFWSVKSQVLLSSGFIYKPSVKPVLLEN